MSLLQAKEMNWVRHNLESLHGLCLVVGSEGGVETDWIEQPLCTNITRAVWKREGTFVVADAQNLPFRDSVFTSAVCKSTLHHLAKPELGLSEMRRTMHKGGTMVMVEPGLLNPIALVARTFFRTSDHVDDEKPFVLSNLDEMVRREFQVTDERQFYITSVGVPVLYKHLALTRFSAAILVGIQKLDEAMIKLGFRQLALVLAYVGRA